MRFAHDFPPQILAIFPTLISVGWGDCRHPYGEVKSGFSVTGVAYRRHNADASPTTVGSHVGQIWVFRKRIKEGEFAVLPLVTVRVHRRGRTKWNCQLH